MKKSFIIALIISIACGLSAQVPGHALSVKTSPTTRFFLYIDGVLQSKKSVSSYTINHIPKGIHQVTVILNCKNRPQSFYQIRMNDRDLCYDIEISGNPKVQYTMTFKPTHPFDTPAEMLLDFLSNKKSTFVAPPAPPAPPVQHGDAGPQGHPIYKDGPQKAQPEEAVAPDMPQPFSTEDFNQLKKLVSKQSFSTDKANVVKEALPGHLVSVDQIIELVQLLSYDNDRLELLKFAYPYCLDQQNYFKVNDELFYSSSKEELRNFISTSNK